MAYTLTYVVVNLVIQNSLYGRWRWPWISELYEYIQSVHLMPAILSVLRNPTKPTFRVTAKDEAIDEARLSELARPFYLIFLVLLLAVGFTVYRLITEPYRAEVTLVVGGWNLFNLLLAGCALGVVSERREVRASRRVPVERKCEILTPEGQWVRAEIVNVSSGGLAVAVADSKVRFAKEETVTLRIATLSPVPDNTLDIFVRNVSNTGRNLVLGGRFMADKPNDYRLIADLLYANSKLWQERQESRQVNIGVILGSLQFLSIAIYQTFRGLGYLARFSRAVVTTQSTPQ